METTFKYDHYYKYVELKSNLEYFEKEYPDLVKLDINCVTLENRNQYVITLTNKKNGSALDKPGWYLDGNIHAGEVTSSMTAMHTIDYLLTNYGSNKEVAKVLDNNTIYVIPRVSPDGAETYLSTPYSLRSVNREYLSKEGGIKSEDIDNDGVIRMMAIPSIYGAWKKDPNNPDSMLKRSPSDDDGEFFDIYPEGILEECGENLKLKKETWGLDFNRNFPFGWFSDSRQPGAGKYPLSNIETKAIVDFVLDHPNIGGAAIGHTSGGIILYPPGTKKAKDAPFNDIKSLKEIAKMGEEELGYKPMNIFDSFMTDQENYDSGALDDWFYQAKGIPSYTMEFWDVASKAGVPDKWGSEEETIEDSLKRFNAIVKWVKENAPEHFVPFKEYDHPTFGKVLIGGFNYKYTVQNPPTKFLLKECENDTKFNIRFIKAMPKLIIDSLNKEEVSNGVYKISVVIGNVGYLPTNLTDEAINLHEDKPVKVSIDNVNLISGKQIEEIGNLSGYSRTITGPYYGEITTFESAASKKKVTWIIKANKGDVIKISAKQEKAGTVTSSITI